MAAGEAGPCAWRLPRRSCRVDSAGATAPASGSTDAARDVRPRKAVPATAQQPGADAQLHTGTSSGLDTDARLQQSARRSPVPAYFQAQLGQLPPDQAQFYRGILANRVKQFEAIDRSCWSRWSKGDCERRCGSRKSCCARRWPKIICALAIGPRRARPTRRSTAGCTRT